MQIPGHILYQMRQHGGGSWNTAESALQQHSSSSGSDQDSGSRHLQQAIPANALNVRPGLKAEAAKPATWATAVVNPKIQGYGIASTFLGISHEWTNIQELNQPGNYQQLLRDLTAYGGGPLVLRVGGGSTDMQTALPPPSVFSELKQLQYSTGGQAVPHMCCAHLAQTGKLYCTCAAHTLLQRGKLHCTSAAHALMRCVLPSCCITQEAEQAHSHIPQALMLCCRVQRQHRSFPAILIVISNRPTITPTAAATTMTTVPNTSPSVLCVLQA